MRTQTFRKTRVRITLDPRYVDGYTRTEYDGFELAAFPALVIHPDPDGREAYTLTHRPTGAAIRNCLRLSEARKLATDLAALVATVPAWSGMDHAAIIDHARNTPDVWRTLTAAPGRF